MRGWVGLYGRPRGGGDRVPPTWKPEQQDAGDHKGPHRPTSAALAPTDHPALCLALMFGYINACYLGVA